MPITKKEEIVRGRMVRYYGVVAAASFALVLLPGCASSTPAESEPSASQPSASPSIAISPPGTHSVTPSPTVVAGPDGTAARPFSFGKLARAGSESRWNVTVSETVTEGTAQVVAENPYNEVKKGWQYVLGRMTSVLNESLARADVGTQLSSASVMPIFIGSDGKIYDIWNDDNSAVVLKEDWIGQEDIIAQVGVTSTGRFAIQVPSAAVSGGRFATRNEVSREIVYFGAPLR